MTVARPRPLLVRLLGLMMTASLGCGDAAHLAEAGADAADGGLDAADADGDLIRDADPAETGTDGTTDDAGLDDTHSDTGSDTGRDTGEHDAAGDVHAPDGDASGGGSSCGDGSALLIAPGAAWDGTQLVCQGRRVELRANTEAVGIALRDGSRGGFDRPTAVFAAPANDPTIWATRDGQPAACLADGVLTVDSRDCTLRLQTGDRTRWSMTLTSIAVDSVAGTGPDEATTVATIAWSTEQPTDGVIVGCGEHTGPLDRRGTRAVHWNTDAYSSLWGGWAPDADPLYASIPFCTTLWPDAALGVVTDAPERTQFDLGASRAGEHRFVSHGMPVLWLLPARAPQQVMRRYHGLTGAPTVPPRWAFGFHQSRWGYNTTAEILAIADGFDERALPLDVLWLDIQHMDGFRTFTFDPVRFADPHVWLAQLAARGLRTVAIADPGIKVDPGWPLYDAAADARLFVENADGTAFVGSVWPGPSSFPDMSLAAARAWWSDGVEQLAARGIDGIWLDVNEPTTFPEGGAGMSIPNSAVARGWPGYTLASLHNLYGQLQAEATVDGLQRGAPTQRPLVVSRAGYLGIHRSAGLWTGDVPSTWWGLEQTLPMLANLSVSGVPFVGSDVGGYSGGATPELYARWFELGVLSPFFRAHVTNGVTGQEPWMFGQEVLDISRIWLRERYRLTPYLEALALDAHRSGAPVLRPLVWEFPADPSLADASSQVMLGPWILAAPVLREGVTEHVVRLPAGRWVGLQSGLPVQGPTEVTTNVTLAAMPLWLRDGAIVPRVEPADRVDALDYATLTVDVVGSDTPSALTIPVGDDGSLRDAGPELTVQQEPIAGGTRVTATRVRGATAQPLRIRLRQFDRPVAAVSLDGRVLALGTEWTRDTNGAFSEVNVWVGDAPARVEFTLGEPAAVPDTIDVAVVVRVPPGTPTDTSIHIAGTFNEWTHAPLAWAPDGRTASGVITVPRDRWYEYKFTRGSWASVEKWPGCVESTNRYAFGGLEADRADEVWEWRDVCER